MLLNNSVLSKNIFCFDKILKSIEDFIKKTGVKIREITNGGGIERDSERVRRIISARLVILL
jgi:hypothetical protein